MPNFTTFKRILKIRFIRRWRSLTYAIGFMRTKKKYSDLLLIKTVKLLIQSPDVRVFFSPISSKVYAYNKEKSIIVIFDNYSVNITNHNYFFTTSLKDGLGEEIMNSAKERIEKDVSELESVITMNEKDFLKSVYTNFSKDK